MSDQEALMMGWGIDMSNACREPLGRAQIKHRDAGSLVVLNSLLVHYADAPETMLVVASLRVLGWTIPDILRALAKAGQCNISLYVIDLNAMFSAQTFNPTLMKGLADTEKVRLRSQTSAARKVAVEASSKTREKRRKAPLEEASPLWIKPDAEISAAEISKQVNMSVTSLKRHLGSRQDARLKALFQGLRDPAKKDAAP